MKYVIDKSSPELIDVDPKLVEKIAHDMVENAAKIKSTDHVMITYDITGRQLAHELGIICAKKGCHVYYYIRDNDMDAKLVANLTDHNIARYLSFEDQMIYVADAVFIIRAPRDTFAFKDVAGDKMRHFGKAKKPVLMDYRVNHTNWQLIYWPTAQEAQIERMSYEEYIELFFKACDQPWQDIEIAQEKIVKVLDQGKHLTIIANPDDSDSSRRTYLEMSIEGMEFLNSTIDKNYPGSEIYSSPVKTSVNGQLFSPGIFTYDGREFADIFFKITDGRIVEAHASMNEKEMLDILDRDEGSRYFGEIAFGTNPGLRQKLLNPLLVEKVGGSFHFTPGQAYEPEMYKGKLVNVDNGNRSEIHWDITTLMLESAGGGEVLVDGKTIQKNGKWLIPGTEVLNKGL